MLRFEWNSLRRGDRVLVHDPREEGTALIPGRIAFINVHGRANGANDLGIRVAEEHGNGCVVLWPSRMVVHTDPRDTTETCWRCSALTAAG